MGDLDDIPGPGEPGFNPDLWEECEDEDEGFLILFWKVAIAMIAITLVAFFFWFLEEHKRRQREKTKKHEDHKESESGDDQLSSKTVEHFQQERNSVEVMVNSMGNELESNAVPHFEEMRRALAEDLSAKPGDDAAEIKTEVSFNFEDSKPLESESASSETSAKVDEGQNESGNVQIRLIRPSDEVGSTTIEILQLSHEEESAPDSTLAETGVSEEGEEGIILIKQSLNEDVALEEEVNDAEPSTDNISDMIEEAEPADFGVDIVGQQHPSPESATTDHDATVIQQDVEEGLSAVADSNKSQKKDLPAEIDHVSAMVTDDQAEHVHDGTSDSNIEPMEQQPVQEDELKLEPSGVMETSTEADSRTLTTDLESSEGQDADFGDGKEPVREHYQEVFTSVELLATEPEAKITFTTQEGDQQMNVEDKHIPIEPAQASALQSAEVAQEQEEKIQLQEVANEGKPAVHEEVQEMPKSVAAHRTTSSEATSLSTVDQDMSIDDSLQKVKVTPDQLENLDEAYDKIKSKLIPDDGEAISESPELSEELAAVHNSEEEANMEMVKSSVTGEATTDEAIIEYPLKVVADFEQPQEDLQWEASVSVSLPSMSSEPEEMPSVTTAPEIESYAATEERGDSEIREELPIDDTVVTHAPIQRPTELNHTSPPPQIDVDIAVTTPSPPQSPSSSNKVSSMLEVLGTSSLTEALMKIQTLQEVSDVMRKAGLQSSNLIFGIDYTASNKYQGENSFGGKSLHSIEPGVNNPYQQVINIMGKTLAPFATSGYIPAFGFGDVHTSDWSVFPLKKDAYCTSFDEVQEVYSRITPKVILSGPTNFAPLILQSIDICKLSGDYHILVIVADGQVTNERATRRAIVDACKYPLSIVVVGVGDGPWDMMRVFDESLPKRPWDNFHFVEFNKIAKIAEDYDLEFAIEALMEIPDQYKKIKKLGLLNKDYGAPPENS